VVEADLEQAFQAGTIDEAALQAQLDRAGELQAQLRFVHLRTHLATIEILSPQQIEQYNHLRGYETSSNSHPHQHE
jgi:Spy/CpxP family protein refolding chaperone